MRGGARLLILVLVFAVAFYLGISYERNNCRIDLPDTVSAIDDTLHCD
jgi:hypothetical protein